MAAPASEEIADVFSQTDTKVLENLVFAEDRLKLLNETFSKSDEAFWFYKLLTLQTRFGSTKNKEAKPLASALEKVEAVEGVRDSPNIQELLLRQAVIDYDKVTKAKRSQTVDRIRDLISPNLEEQQGQVVKGRSKSKKYESSINLNTNKLLQDAWKSLTLTKKTKKKVSEVFTKTAAIWLTNQKLTNDMADDFLRLVEEEPPEIPYLLAHIKKDLENNITGGFGSKKIHFKLTKESLDLLSKTKACQSSETYMQCYAWKLRKVTEGSFIYDMDLRGRYLNDLRDFASNVLAKTPKFNSLRALILYNWLLYNERQGNYDKRVLKTYLKIPKTSFYCQEVWVTANKKHFASLDYEVDLIQELFAIVDDEPYVRRALRHIFSSFDDTTAKWKDVIDLQYLRRLYCEVKLTKSQGKTAELRRAYGKFGKYAFQELTNAVNVELLRSNQVYHTVNDTVSVTVLLKNVPELEVRIFQVDCAEYFTRFNHRVDLDIPLEGLAPNYIIRKQFNDPPLLERSRTLELSQLKGKRGVFLIEFFGNGVKCRALIRKGELRYTTKQCKNERIAKEGKSGLGYQFMLFDEENVQCKTATITIQEKAYTAEADGTIFIPFAEEDIDACPLVIEDSKIPGSATIHFMDYKTENYRLECGMFIDRESLLEKKQAQVIVRPTLLLNDEPVSVDNLKNVQLSMVTMDAEGFEVKRLVNLSFGDTKEAITRFVVPTELRSVQLSLTCNVFAVSQDQQITLQKDESFTINDIDKTNALADLHLRLKGKYGYNLLVLGKNGEPYSNVVIDVELSHRYFQEKIKYTLETDKEGKIQLGRLPDTTMLQAVARSDLVYHGEDEDAKHCWYLLNDQVNVPGVVNIKKGDIVRIPFMKGGEQDPAVNVYDEHYVRKFTNHNYKNGYVEIKGLPGGTFKCYIRDYQGVQDAEVDIHVSKGRVLGNHAVSNNRIVELSEEKPLQITKVDGSRNTGYVCNLDGINEGTRVHVFSSHLVPRFNSYSFLVSPEIVPTVLDYSAYPASYGEMEEVSSEFKYISNRKHAKKYTGNNLARPTLLSKRWTTSGPPKQRRPPTDFDDEVQNVQPQMRARYDRKRDVVTIIPKIEFDSSNLEFLSETSSVLANLRPEADGTLKIPASAVSPFHNVIQIIAVDADNTCQRTLVLPPPTVGKKTEVSQDYRDVRLTNGLDPAVHWTERREILELPESGSKLFVENFSTSEIETYDDLTDVFDLFNTLSENTTLSAFRFITRWNEFDQEQKLDFFDNYMSNELNFFIFQKDRAFFDKVVLPVLKSKVQKGFMDLYLLDLPLNEFTAVVKYQSLNTLERILLASKIKDLSELTLKALQDFESGSTEVPQESDELFTAALESKQLSADYLDSWIKKKVQPKFSQYEKTGKVIDQSREYQETRYYQVEFNQQDQHLVTPNRFWLDYAKFMLQNEGKGSFVSKSFYKPVGNLTQMLLALGCLDMPFRSTVKDADIEYIGNSGSVNVMVHQPTLVLSRQIKKSVVQSSALAVSTNYFDPEDQFEVVDFEKQDKFLKMPLVTQKVYGCRVVITNVSSMKHEVELLNQIPVGSIPVRNGFRTKNIVEELDPYTTKFREFYFYFPFAGNFTHYQTRVSKNGKVIGYGLEESEIIVVDPEDLEDKESWEYFSMKADNKELLQFLESSPKVHTVDLAKIAWRMHETEMFLNVTQILRDRQIYNEILWAFSLKHYAANEMKEYLSMQERFLSLISPDLQTSSLTDFDAFDRQEFQVMEYWPLIPTRAHSQAFKNTFFQAQYREYLKRCFYRSYSVLSLNPADQMVGVYYFLIQNRVKDALDTFEKIDEDAASEVSQMTYDYLRAYLAFSSGHVHEITKASELCENYLAKTLPPSKQAQWEGVHKYLQELKDPAFADELFDPTTEADITSARAKKLECEVNSDRTLTISYKNVSSVEINFYRTDIELQFSTAPFRKEHNAFNFVAPTEKMTIELDPNEKNHTFDLPVTLHDKCSIAEIIGSGFVISKPNYDNHLRIEISEALEQIRVFNKTSNKPIPKAYVKVYAQTPDAPEGRFLKDGYTDLRGRFDYARVSSDEMKFCKGLAILVLTDSAGADVIEIGY